MIRPQTITVANHKMAEKHLIKNESAFTLTEMLVTMLIMVLASTLLATGIPVAVDTYQKTVKSANAQVALSTTITVLRSELGMATDVRVKDNGVYYCANEGYWACIRNPKNDESYHGLVKQYYGGEPSGTNPLDTEGLVPLHEDGNPSNPLMIYPLIPDASIVGTRSENPLLWVRFQSVARSSSSTGANTTYLQSVDFTNLCVFQDMNYSSGLHTYEGDQDQIYAGSDSTENYLVLTPFVTEITV